MLGVSEPGLVRRTPQGPELAASRSLNHREQADPLPSSSLDDISAGKFRRLAVMLSNPLVFCMLLYVRMCIHKVAVYRLSPPSFADFKLIFPIRPFFSFVMYCTPPVPRNFRQTLPLKTYDRLFSPQIVCSQPQLNP